MNFIGKIAIVTGAGQGMGRGIALKLAEDGASVVVTDINEKGALETTAIIAAAGFKAFAVKADISVLSDIQGMFEKCEQRCGKPDILVANASLSYISALLDTTEEEYYKVFDINAKGTLFCLKEAGLHLNDNGRIVVISSSSTRYPVRGMSLYAASKAAQKLMVEVAAQELAGRGITVNSVMPGVTETPSMKAGLSIEYQEQIIRNAPFKRLGTPKDIAEVVAFLCSANAQWVSGQHILTNGGSLS